MRSFIASAILLALAAFPASLAAPAPQRGGRPTGRPGSGTAVPTVVPSRPGTAFPTVVPSRPGTGTALPGRIIGCTVTVLPTLPSNQTKLAVPTGEKVEFVGLGVGTQNYTCGAAGTYAAAGAVARLYDVSCAANKQSLVKTLPALALRLSKARSPVGPGIASAAGGNPFFLGDHFFIVNAAGAKVPKFDFTVSQKQSAFVVAAKKDGVPAPNTANDVDLLQLTRTEGTIGKTIFRLDTVGGQPPKTCTPGTSPDVQIPYAANYYFTV